MKEQNKIERNLSSAVSELIPKDMYERIEKKLDRPEAGAILVTKKEPARKRILPRFTGILAAACLLLAVGLVGFGHYRNHVMVASTVDIDVNPSIEIAVNRLDRVLAVKAVNEDAAALLSNLDLKGTDLDAAINAIIGAMAEEGYFEGEDGEILVTVRHRDAEKAKSLRALLVSDIDAALKENDAAAAILNQTVTDETPSEEAKALAEKQGVSVGKAVFVLNLADKDEELAPEELAKKSLKEISHVVRDKKIDIRDIVDFDEDDGLFGDPSAAELPEGASLSAAEAKTLALTHAGLDEEKACFVKVELEKEGDALVYEIELVSDGVLYEIEIDAANGEILSSETKEMTRPGGNKPNDKNPEKEPPVNERPEDGTAETEDVIPENKPEENHPDHSHPEDKPVEGERPEDGTAETEDVIPESKPEEDRPDHSHPEDKPVESERPEDVTAETEDVIPESKPEEDRPDHIHPEDKPAEGERPEDVTAETEDVIPESKPEENHPDHSRPEDKPAEGERPEDGTAETDDAIPESKPEENHPDHSRPEDKSAEGERPEEDDKPESKPAEEMPEESRPDHEGRPDGDKPAVEPAVSDLPEEELPETDAPSQLPPAEMPEGERPEEEPSVSGRPEEPAPETDIPSQLPPAEMPEGERPEDAPEENGGRPASPEAEHLANEGKNPHAPL